MRILVTGAAGFIGTHLIEDLLASGHSVIGLTRYASGASELSRKRQPQLDALQRKHSDHFQLVRCEAGPALTDTLRKLSPDGCVHLAGRSWVRESVAYPELYADTNYRGTLALLEALRLSGCQRVVFASTVMIYGNDAPLPYMEEQIGRFPASPYGATKLAGETLVNTYAALHGMIGVNLRLFSVYGPGLRPDLVPHLVASAILKNKPFTVFGDGSSLRDYIEIRDVVAAFRAALHVERSHAALNIGSGFGTSLLELIACIETALGQKTELQFKPPVPGELQAAVPDITQSMEVLKWEPRIPLDEGLQRTCKWLKQQR